MIGEAVGPVCSPDFLSRLSPNSPDGLASARILGTATRKEAWNEWLSAVGRRDLLVKVHEEYEHFNLMLQAASFGVGIAVAPRYLVERELATGQPIAPYGFVLGPHRLQLWIAHHARLQPEVKVLARWIEEKMTGRT
jgi:DNA-binding transcriptional LysR family regulator